MSCCSCFGFRKNKKPACDLDERLLGDGERQDENEEVKERDTQCVASDRSFRLSDLQFSETTWKTTVTPSATTGDIPHAIIDDDDVRMGTNSIEFLPSAPCQDHPGKKHYTHHIQHSGTLKVRIDDGEKVSWENCKASLEEGTLTIEGLDFSPLKHQVILDNMRVEVVNEKFKEFSLVPVKTIDLPYQSDMKLESLHFSATSECYTAWVLALEDAIKVCYVKSLLSGFRGRTQVSMEWYKKQYEQYEKAMNTIEYGSNFVLHTSASNTVKKNLGTVRIWLQADEEDTGLMFFPAVDESATSHSSSFRKTTFSSLEHGDGNNRRTFDNSAGSSQISNEAFHTDIINCGIVLPFYHILGVSKGTKDKIVKCNSSSGCFTLTTADDIYVLEAESREKRDQWAQSITDVVNFCNIPSPNAMK